MTIRVRFILVTAAIILVTMTVGCWFIYQQQARTFEKHICDITALVSNFTLADRDYLKDDLHSAMPKKTAHLSTEEISGAFVSRGISEMLEHKMPEYLYRQTALNPRNLSNKPNDFERGLLTTLQNTAANELSGYQIINNQEVFYVARAVVMQEKCLPCHGNPAHAPPGIIDRYGNENGFNWVVGTVVGSTIITTPTTQLRHAQAAQLKHVIAVFAALFVVLLVTIYFFFERLFNHPIRTTTRAMAQIAGNPHSGLRLPESAHGEFGIMASAFNKMAETITQHRDTLEEKIAERTSELKDQITERRRTEERTGHVNRAVESSRNEIYVFDAETLRFLEVNPGAQDNLGYSLTELRKLTPLDLNPEITAEAFAEIIKPLRDGTQENVQFTATHQRKDGSLYPIEAYLQLTKDRTPVYVAIIFDITERKEAEYEMHKLSTAIEQSPVTVVITDLGGRIQYVNPKFMETTGYTAEEAIGQNPRILQSGEMSPDDYKKMWETISTGAVWRGEFHNRKKNGELYWEAASISPIRDAEGVITNFLAVKEDITERKEAERQLEIAATTDKLTGLPNRAVLLDRVGQALIQYERTGNRFAVLFFDFDRFKVVNDSLGHDVGDALLCDIADIFRRELRATDTVARIGGDEFVMLLTNLVEWSDAQLKAARLLKAFAEPHILEGHHVVSTASIGLVTCEREYELASEMIRDADAAMYQAKEAGRGQVVVFGRAMHEQAMDRLVLESDLHNAIAKQQLSLHYQPIIELSTGALAGFEALVRWEHPTRGFISPEEFIPIAEATGMIVEIGRWVLQVAARQIADWNQRLGLARTLSININVSKRQLLSPTFMTDVLQCQREHSLYSQEMKLEITESLIVDERADIVPLLRQLHEHGFSIVMDDFGTGVSSLGTLHEYPIDVLKIDQSFIRPLDRNRSLLAIVASITSLAENLGIKTVAEGIETADIVGALQSIGCAWGQGYHFAKPLTTTAAEAYILERQKEHRAA